MHEQAIYKNTPHVTNHSNWKSISQSNWAYTVYTIPNESVNKEQMWVLMRQCQDRHKTSK